MIPDRRRARLALACVGLIAAWVLAGAVFKLLWGTPALLPKVVRESASGLGLELGLTYKLAIGIELATVAVALTRPRWGWWLQAALMVGFEIVLTTQIAAHEKSCGCFGTKLTIDPRLMMGIDSTLLVALLASRPWSCLGRGLPVPFPVALAALGLALPWFHDREVKPGEVIVGGKPVEGDWIELDLESWVGKDIWDTPLGQPPLDRYIDVVQLPLDGLWVFWRATCDHCAEHLQQLAQSEHGERLITLVQLEEQHDTLANRVVHVLPDGNFVKHAALPPAITYLLQTPGELLLESGQVVAAADAVTAETSLARSR